MSGRTRPPRWAERLLEGVVGSSSWGPAAVGDLAEAYSRMRRTRATLACDLWYVLQVASVTGHRALGRGEAAGAGKGAGLLADARGAVRASLRRPLLTTTVVGTLALGLGANAAVFRVIDGTMRATDWWADAAAALVLWPGHTFSRGQLDIFRTRTAAFETVGAYRLETFTASAQGGATSSVPGAHITADLFSALRIRPVLGRGFFPEDERPGGEPPVVVSHAFWQRELGGASEAVGMRIEVNGEPRTVVGVQGRGGTAPGPGTELWLPVVIDANDPDLFPDVTYTFVGILRPGMTAADGQETLRAFGRRLSEMFPFFYRPDYLQDGTVELATAQQRALLRTPLLLLMGGTAVLLLIAAFNVGNLLMTRTVERRGELAVRRALGAGRGRLVRQLVTESALVAVSGTALAVVVAGPAARALTGIFPADVSVTRSPWTSPPVALFLAGATLLVWLVLAGVPVGAFLNGDRGSVHERLRKDGKPPRTLVVVQSALATLLLVSSGLLVQSVSNLRNVPLGFDPGSVTAVYLSPPAAYLGEGDRLRGFQEEIVERALALPGVSAAGMTSTLPLDDVPPTQPVQPEDARIDVNEAVRADFFAVDAGFLEAMDIRLESGRPFGSTERADQPTTAMVNRALAERLWPGQDPVGRSIAIDPHAWERFVPVVGVVGDFRSGGLAGPPRPAVFVARYEQPTRRTALVVRSSSVGAVGPVLRRMVADTDPSVAVGAVRPLQDVVRDAYGAASVTMGLLGAMALLATALAALGINAVLGHHVARGRREIAVRLALGARRISVVGRIMGSGLRQTLFGVILGCVLGAASVRLLEALLFGVEGLSVAVLLLPALLVAMAAGIAALGPAVRAGRTAPGDVLRGE